VVIVPARYRARYPSPGFLFALESFRRNLMQGRTYIRIRTGPSVEPLMVPITLIGMSNTRYPTGWTSAILR
jgi:hypothetical protein